MDSKGIPDSKILDCSIRFSKPTTGQWGKLHFQGRRRSHHWFLEGQASLPLRRQEGSHGRRHSPPQSLRPGSTEQSVLVLTELPPGDESHGGKGVPGARLPCLVNGMPYMALVFLTGDMFLDMKFILKSVLQVTFRQCLLGFVSHNKVSKVTAFPLGSFFLATSSCHSF